VLEHYRPQIEASTVLERLGLPANGYLLVSAHREENVDAPERLQALLDCLVGVQTSFGLPVLVSTHPRTRKRLEALPGWAAPEGLHFHEPFGFNDYNKLQLGAACVLSDSGTIAEESTILGFPAITLRDSIERPEALDTGGIVMTGLHREDVIAAVRLVRHGLGTDRLRTELVPGDYLIRNTSQRAVHFIVSTARRHASWSGLHAASISR
jgi:UDP-N-acetylglucosamine 2-epimerase (non-hydrolysing)